jgi:hypothetical protein
LLDRQTVLRVHAALAVPDTDRESRVAERAREPALERPRIVEIAEIDHQAAQNRFGPAGAEQVDEQDRREPSDREVVDPEHQPVGIGTRESDRGSKRQDAGEGQRGEKRGAAAARSMPDVPRKTRTAATATSTLNATVSRSSRVSGATAESTNATAIATRASVLRGRRPLG